MNGISMFTRPHIPWDRRVLLWIAQAEHMKPTSGVSTYCATVGGRLMNARTGPAFVLVCVVFDQLNTPTWKPP